MNISRTTLAGTTVVAALLATGGAANAGSKPPLPFDEASVRFVANRTDSDGQLFWSVTFENRMADVAIHAPSGKLVARAVLDRAGEADVRFDSPEPTVAQLKRTYPAGVYTVTGHATDGRRLASTVTVSYAHVGSPTIVSPTADQAGVPTTGFVVEWTAVPSAAGYHIQVESDSPASALEVDLGPDATSLAVPDGFLVPDTEYVVDVLAEHSGGNGTLRDVTLTTGAH